MLGLARWCIAHRRWVVIAWVAVAVGTTAIAGAVGRNYATNFQLKGTESQRAQDLLSREFNTQGGDQDTVVWRTNGSTVDSPSVRSTMTGLLARVATMPHVVAVISPYGSKGTAQVSRDRRTAFAIISYSKRANLLPNDTGKPVLNAINAAARPGLEIAAGGQVIEQAEGF